MFLKHESVPFSALVLNNIEVITNECKNIIAETPKWRETEIYEGSWQLFVFYDYEAESDDGMQDNLSRCPATAHLLQGIPGRHAASFSILGPESRIKPHLGLENGLLRYHCGLRVPSNCTLGAMSRHAGLSVDDVTSIGGLFAALNQPRNELGLFWHYAPDSLLAAVKAFPATDGEHAMLLDATLAGINHLINDLEFPVRAMQAGVNLRAYPQTAEWLRVLEREGILREQQGGPAIAIEYLSQQELIRWLSTAFVSEVLFPGVFAMSPSFERRILAEHAPFIFSDAYIHDAENGSDELRYVLLIDFEPKLNGLAIN